MKKEPHRRGNVVLYEFPQMFIRGLQLEFVRKALPKSFLDWIRFDLECVNLKGVCASTESVGEGGQSTAPFVFNCLARGIYSKLFAGCRALAKECTQITLQTIAGSEYNWSSCSG